MLDDVEILDPDTGESEAVEVPDDYLAFEQYMENGHKAPAAGEEAALPSEPSETAEVVDDGQTAVEPETAEEVEQVADENPDNPDNQDRNGDGRLAKRMRKLTGEIARLQTRLEELGDEHQPETETAEEVASSPESDRAKPEPPKRPSLKDFQDTEDKSAWDQYEEAAAAYTQQQIDDAIKRTQAEDGAKHAQEMAQNEWNRQAARFPDFNEVVRAEIKISSAMEQVMRMDPEAGTELAYYLGQHPEESEKIARATLASNDVEWSRAIARAGVELGKIHAKAQAGKPVLVAAAPPKPPAPKPGPPVSGRATVAPPAAAPKPKPKQVSNANRPPSQVRGVIAPRADPLDDETASNYAEWESAREAQIKRK